MAELPAAAPHRLIGGRGEEIIREKREKRKISGASSRVSALSLSLFPFLYTLNRTPTASFTAQWINTMLLGVPRVSRGRGRVGNGGKLVK